MAERLKNITQTGNLAALSLVVTAGLVVAFTNWDFRFPMRIVTYWQEGRIFSYYWGRLWVYLAVTTLVFLLLWFLVSLVAARARGADLGQTMQGKALHFAPAFLLLLSLARYWVSPLGVNYGSSVWRFYTILIISSIGAPLLGGLARDLLLGERLARRKGLIITLVTAAALAYFLTFSILAVSKHDSFKTHALDLGTMDQATWNTSQGRILEISSLMPAPVKEPQRINRLTSGKLELVFLPLALLYRIRADPRMLLILQTLLIAAGALPLYLIASDRFSRLGEGDTSAPGQLAALALVVAYLAYLPLHYANLHDFHAIVLAVPFLLLTFWALSKKRWSPYYLAWGLALITRIDVALIGFFLGAYLILAEKERAHGTVTAILSALWFLLDFKVVVPYVEGIYGPESYDLFAVRFGRFGQGPLAIVQGTLTQPWLAMSFLLTRDNVQTIAELLMPLGLLPLLNPLSLLPAAPILAANLLSTSAHQRTITAHYQAPAIPFFFMAAIYGMHWLSTVLRRQASSDGPRWLYTLAAFMLLNTLLVDFHFSPFPLGKQFRPANFRQITSHERNLQEVLSLVPANAAVSAQSDIFPHLSHRRDIYLFPSLGDAEYVVVDLDASSEKTPLGFHDFYWWVDRLLEDERFGVRTFVNGVLLLQRGLPGHNIQQVREEIEQYHQQFYRVDFTAYRGPSRLKRYEKYFVEVSLQNVGSQGWRSVDWYPTKLSYHWLTDDGQVYEWDGQRTSFHHIVKPGESLTVAAMLITPQEPGRYILEWDLVREEMTWFSRQGGKTMRIAVVVE
ncbi:MAG: DUF2079 domain-containing protein [Anaerolineae bacterium]